MKNRHALPIVALLTALVLAGCAPTSDGSATPTPTPSPTVSEAPPLPQAEFATVAAAEVANVIPQTQNDEVAHIYASVPTVDSVDALNAESTAFAKTQVDDYLEATSKGTEHSFLSVGWQTLGASPHTVGFLLTSNVSPGGSVAQSQKSIWLDVEKRAVLGVKDLLTPAGIDAAVAAVTDTLAGHVDAAAVAAASDIVRTGTPTVGFDATGTLLVGFDAYQVGPGAIGAPVIAVPGEPQTLLTAAGQLARSSTLEPSQLTIEPPAASAPEQPAVDCAAQKCVALTFDDGPSGATTPRLLDILKEKDVRATFFALGSQVQARPDIVQREAAEGHEVENHSWSHPQLTGLSAEAMQSEITRTSDAIATATGRKPVFLRPPYGARNAAVDQAAAAAGLAEGLWSVDTLDWKTHDPAQTIAAASKAKPGAIVLMHDIHATTVDAVPGVIDALRSQGFTFVTVSQLVGTPQPGTPYFGTY